MYFLWQQSSPVGADPVQILFDLHESSAEVVSKDLTDGVD